MIQVDPLVADLGLDAQTTVTEREQGVELWEWQ